VLQGHLLPPFPDEAPTEPPVNTSGGSGAHWWLPSETAHEADQPSAATRIGACRPPVSYECTNAAAVSKTATFACSQGESSCWLKGMPGRCRTFLSQGLPHDEPDPPFGRSGRLERTPCSCTSDASVDCTTVGRCVGDVLHCAQMLSSGSTRTGSRIHVRRSAACRRWRMRGPRPPAWPSRCRPCRPGRLTTS